MQFQPGQASNIRELVELDQLMSPQERMLQAQQEQSRQQQMSMLNLLKFMQQSQAELTQVMAQQ